MPSFHGCTALVRQPSLKIIFFLPQDICIDITYSIHNVSSPRRRKNRKSSRTNNVLCKWRKKRFAGRDLILISAVLKKGTSLTGIKMTGNPVSIATYERM